MTGSGVVTAIGKDVKSLRVGDAVYGLVFKHGEVFPPKPPPGFVSDYVVAPAEFLLTKPSHLSFEEAAALAGSVCTARQCVKRYFELKGLPPDTESLEGKTVFVPGALSSTGSVFIQVLKNVYGASSIISTVSTPKMPLVEQHLPGMVDKLIDYSQTQNVVEQIGKGTVDFVLNTQWNYLSTFPLANPQTGTIVSIASIPSVRTIRKMLGDAQFALRFVPIGIATVANWWYDWNLRGTNVKQDFVSGNMGDREDLEKSGEWIAAGKVKAVMTIVDIDDLAAVRRGCGMVATGKGGLGKLVIRLVK